MKEKKLVLIDGHALLYRAFFSFPSTLTLPGGQMVNAAYGFSRILLATMAELKPTHVAVSFDVGKTFRHTEYEAYKAHREKMPDELKSQEPIVQEILGDLNVPMYSVMGYEADDVIGTVAKQATEDQKHPAKALIVTGDHDMWQLVNEQIHVFIPGSGKRVSREVDREAVKKSMGVWPEQVADYKSLAGDSSDNYPGVKGIGPKTAAALISQFQSMERLYKQLEEGELATAGVSQSVAKKLLADKKNATLSKRLATIVTTVPTTFNWDTCKITTYDKDKAIAVLDKYNFKSLIPALPVDTFEESVQEALF